MRALQNAFINSLIIYHFTPLFGANLISEQEIDRYETYLKRTLLRIPNDIKSNSIDNVTSWSKMPISSTINRIYSKLVLKEHNKPLERIPIKFRNSSIRVMAIDKNIRNLMLATTKSRTVVNYHSRHYCKAHKQHLDENHIESCSYL
jgi:hypothetical protein